jgi:predicted NodU family carbamoyl transferase
MASPPMVGTNVPARYGRKRAPEANPLFAAILRCSATRPGLRRWSTPAVLVNTSFSVREEPILDRAQECLRTLVGGRLDFVVTKNTTYVVGEAAA